MIYTINYTVPTPKEFDVNIDVLAELIFDDFVSNGYAPDLNGMLNYFDDNISILLYNLGFPEATEFDDTKLDEIYKDILPYLDISLKGLIKEHETNNDRSDNN